ncbi:MAG: D-2-hydroxyacid dehydrogenase [Halolamina sp.]
MSVDIGVHRSVENACPPAAVASAVAEGEAVGDVVVGDAETVTAADAVVTFAYDPALLEGAATWIHSVQAGVDRFPFADLREAEVALTSSSGIHGDAVGETVLGYALSFARRLHRHRDDQRERTWEWPAYGDAFTLAGEQLCVIGLGSLGEGVARRADALGMEVVGVRRTPTRVEHVETVFTPDRLQTAVADARFVAVTVPLTPATEGLVDADALGAMPDSAYLLDVSRGGVVDEAALRSALAADGLAGVARDVYDAEPLPESSPFWDREDCIVTPHAAAAVDDYHERVARIVRENAQRLLAGESLANAVVE